MSIQTTIEAAPFAGRPGQEGDAGFSHVVGGIAGGSIDFGRVCVRTSSNGWRLIADGDDLTLLQGCVSLIDHALPTQQGYVEGCDFRGMEEGAVWVECVGAVAVGATVAVVVAAGADQGKVVDSGSAATGDIILDGCRVEEASSNGCVKLMVGSPMSNTAPTA